MKEFSPYIQMDKTPYSESFAQLKLNVTMFPFTMEHSISKDKVHTFILCQN